MWNVRKRLVVVLVASALSYTAQSNAEASNYYKGTSKSKVNIGHLSKKYSPPHRGVNRPPPRPGAYYQGIFRDRR